MQNCSNGGCAEAAAGSYRWEERAENVPAYEPTRYIPKAPEAAFAVDEVVLNERPSFSGGAAAAVSPGMPAENLPAQEEIFQNAPLFEVPLNSIAPPGYQTVMDYGSLQYMNGFLRTQMGKYVRIQQMVGASVIEDRYGYIVGVGINYVLLQEISTRNILVLDFYNIKFVYIYYNKTNLPTNGNT